MKFSTVGLTLVFSCLALSACSSNSGGGGGGGQGGGEPQASSKAEALAMLSPEARQGFENWSKQIVKSCDAAESIGGGRSTDYNTSGIDAQALLAKNAGSVVFSDGDSRMVILADYDRISGTSESSHSRTVTINGQSKSLRVKAQRSGSSCAVYFFGFKVYETQLLAKYFVGADWSAGKQVEFNLAPPKIKTLGAGGVAEVLESGLFELLSRSLQPGDESLTLLGAKLGLESDVVKKFFAPSYRYSPAAVRIDGDTASLWSSRGQGVIGSGATLSTAFGGGAYSLPMEVRLAIPRFTLGDIRNTADDGALKLKLNAGIVKKDTNFVYKAQSLQLLGVIPFDKDEALVCAKSRAHLYAGARTRPTAVEPQLDQTFYPCENLYPEVTKAAYESGLMQSLTPVLLAGITPSSQTQYGGWENVVAKLVLEAIKSGKSIRAELDPEGRTQVIGPIANNLESLQGELAQTTKLESSKERIFRLGVDWALSGHVITPNRIVLMIRALENAIEPFEASTSSLMLSLGNNPNRSDEELQFALNLSAEYKAEGRKLAGLAADLNYSDVRFSVLNRVLQEQISIATLREWNATLGEIKTEIVRYPNLAPVKGELVAVAVKHRRSGEATPQDISELYAAMNTVAVPFEVSSKKLLSDLNSSFATNKEAIAFARSLTPEYMQLAVSIRANAKAVDYESWGVSFYETVLQKRPSLQQLRDWDSLWTGALQFTQREKNRTAGESGTTNEWYRKDIVKTAVNENWTTADFTSLEAIALMAKTKMECERHVGMSSLANCAGLDRFRKHAGKFLDPALRDLYVPLAADFINYVRIVDSEFSLKIEFPRAFFGTWSPIWSDCAAETFRQKALTLKSSVNKWAATSDQIEKWRIEREIKDTLKSCR